MGLLSSSKSNAAQSTAVADNQSLSFAGNRNSVGSVVAHGSSTINYLSDDVVKYALDYAAGEGAGSRDFAENALSAFVAQGERSAAAIQQTAYKAIESQRSEGAETFKFLLYAGVAVAAIIALPAILKEFK
jgi:hypothetical protein